MKNEKNGSLVGDTSVLEIERHDCAMEITPGSQEQSFPVFEGSLLI